jgi:hypothetical protein
MAPNTAFRGRHIPEDSLAISTAILNEESMERPMEADERESVSGFLLDASFRTKFTGNVGIEAGISPDDLDLRRKRIVSGGRW